MEIWRNSPILADLIHSNSYTTCIDPQFGYSNGYPRALPLLLSLPDQRPISIVTPQPGNNCTTPINLFSENVHFTTPVDVEFSDEFQIILVDRESESQCGYISRMIEYQSPKIFLVQESGFIPNSWIFSEKRLEDRASVTPIRFEQKYLATIRDYNLESFQMPETKNIFFVLLAYIQSLLTGRKPANLTDIFNYDDPRLTVTPIWDLAIRAIELRQDNHVQNNRVFLFNAFRPWLERNKDVSIVSQKIDNLLSLCKYQIPLIKERRRAMFCELDENLPPITHVMPDFLIQSHFPRELE